MTFLRQERKKDCQTQLLAEKKLFVQIKFLPHFIVQLILLFVKKGPPQIIISHHLLHRQVLITKTTQVTLKTFFSMAAQAL